MPDINSVIEAAVENDNGRTLDPAFVQAVVSAADQPSLIEAVLGGVEIVVPVAFFLAIVVTVFTIVYVRYRTRREVQTTIRAAIERGQELTPEILERMGQPADPKNRDLRRGVMSVAIGLGLAAFGLLLPEEEAAQPLMAIGSLPFLIGLAYIGLWYLGGRKR